MRLTRRLSGVRWLAALWLGDGGWLGACAVLLVSGRCGGGRCVRRAQVTDNQIWLLRLTEDTTVLPVIGYPPAGRVQFTGFILKHAGVSS